MHVSLNPTFALQGSYLHKYTVANGKESKVSSLQLQSVEWEYIAQVHACHGGDNLNNN